MEPPASRRRVSPPTGDNLREFVENELNHGTDRIGPVVDECQSADEEEGELGEALRGEGTSQQTDCIIELFDKQCQLMESRALEQKRRAQLTVCVRQDTAEVTSSESVSFERFASDHFKGDARLRALKNLLALIDTRGFERSTNQVRFHDAFIRACGRVLYKEEWSVHRSKIMQQNGWLTTPGEVMISTPR